MFVDANKTSEVYAPPSHVISMRLRDSDRGHTPCQFALERPRASSRAPPSPPDPPTPHSRSVLADLFDIPEASCLCEFKILCLTGLCTVLPVQRGPGCSSPEPYLFCLRHFLQRIPLNPWVAFGRDVLRHSGCLGCSSSTSSFLLFSERMELGSAFPSHLQ